MNYLPTQQRYQEMTYRRCGKSGIKLPALSLGLWHYFGDVDRGYRNGFPAGQLCHEPAGRLQPRRTGRSSDGKN